MPTGNWHAAPGRLSRGAPLTRSSDGQADARATAATWIARNPERQPTSGRVGLACPSAPGCSRIAEPRAQGLTCRMTQLLIYARSRPGTGGRAPRRPAPGHRLSPMHSRGPLQRSPFLSWQSEPAGGQPRTSALFAQDSPSPRASAMDAITSLAPPLIGSCRPRPRPSPAARLLEERSLRDQGGRDSGIRCFDQG
jgi:hypothetical protein